jgi:hypothetical protein
LLNHAFDDVIDHGWTPSSACQRRHLFEQKSIAQKNEELLDEVPVMSATVLGLEMLLHEPNIDLTVASAFILSDVGATIQILRLIGRGYDFDEDRPRRMGDCLASLEVGIWFGAISARTFVCGRKNAEATALWQHCRLVAEYARLVAESTDCVSSEDAYLVGLLHGIGAFPAVLGWQNGGPGALLAMEGALPLVILNAMRSVYDSGSSSEWKFILVAAHELAGGTQHSVPTSIHEMIPREISLR